MSEIVTNALRYGEPDIVLRIREHLPGIGVSVRDSGTGQPHRPSAPPPADAPRGRGLLIVDAFASRWGIVASDPPRGKTVWFELDS